MMEEKNTAITVVENEAPISPFTSTKTFETAQRMAGALCSSSLVPPPYRGRENLANCIIALEMANRTGVSPFLIMQNMHVIQGRPSMSAQYLIAMINASGKFSPLRWKVEKRGVKKFGSFQLEDCTYIAWARELSTGEILEGPEVTTEMAVKENWYGKNGSKWQTMPDLMFRYRAAAFFSRMYCPEMAMGLHTVEEIEDMEPQTVEKRQSAKERAEKLTKELNRTAEEMKAQHDEVIDASFSGTDDAVKDNSPEDLGFAKKAPDRAAPKAERPVTEARQATMDFDSAPPDDAFELPPMPEPADGDSVDF